MADATIKDFSDSIEGIHQCMEEDRSSPGSAFNKMFCVFIEVSTFVGFSFCDFVALSKSFIITSNSHGKSFSEESCRFSLMRASKYYMVYRAKSQRFL